MEEGSPARSQQRKRCCLSPEEPRDEDLGAFDTDLPADFVEKNLTSEQKARRSVSGKEPDRLNLRTLLDGVFGQGSALAQADDAGNLSDQRGGDIDVQSVRRLVGALVNSVARHTKHGMTVWRRCRLDSVVWSLSSPFQRPERLHDQ